MPRGGTWVDMVDWHLETLEGDDVFIIWLVVMVSWVYLRGLLEKIPAIVNRTRMV